MIQSAVFFSIMYIDWLCRWWDCVDKESEDFLLFISCCPKTQESTSFWLNLKRVLCFSFGTGCVVSVYGSSVLLMKNTGKNIKCYELSVSLMN